MQYNIWYEGLKDSLVVGLHYYTAQLAAVCPASPPCPELPAIPGCPGLTCGACSCPPAPSVTRSVLIGAALAVGFLTLGLAAGSAAGFLAGRLLPAVRCPRRAPDSPAGAKAPVVPATSSTLADSLALEAPHSATDFEQEARAQAAAARERRASAAASRS